MGRRKQSAFKDYIELASYLPWWLGLILAVASYFLIHPFAVMEIAPLADGKEMGGYLGRHIWKMIASVFQFVIPLVFLFGALISGINKWRRGSIFKQQTGIDSIRELSWYQFELLISEAFRRQGYRVTETEYGPDGGVDLILHKDDRRLFVQCKHWKVYKINVKPIRELQGVISARGADGGIFVTSGEYTKDALDFARDCNIQLIDGDDLDAMFSGISIEDAEPTVISERPSCPQCGSRMVKRTAKKGANAGKEFWGCSTFPACKGIMNI